MNHLPQATYAVLIAPLVLLSTAAAAEDTVPIRVKTYLDKKYPGWALAKVDKEACASDGPLRPIVSGDFDADGRIDHAIQFIRERRYYLLALLDTGLVYTLESHPNSTENYSFIHTGAWDMGLMVKKNAAAHADVEREYRASPDIVQMIDCGSASTTYTFETGRWKKVMSRGE